MAIPASGAINLAGTSSPVSVASELGLGLTTAITMNDAAVRTLAGAGGSGVSWSMSSLYGKANRVSISYTFSASTANASLNVAAIGGYIAGKSNITVTVNSGVYLYATTTGGYALNLTGGTAGDTVTLVNNGFIMGQGGTGGSVIDSTYPAATAGGPALNLGFGVSTITINTQSGYIGGGGGGGGVGSAVKAVTTAGGGAGGGAGGSQTFNSSPPSYYAGGTGGGIGSSGGNGQAQTSFDVTGGGGGRIMPGTTIAGPTSSNNFAAGYGGSAGGTGAEANVNAASTSTGGSGGGGGSAGGSGYSNTYGAASGGGGGWGASGGAGVATGDTPVARPGAAGGKAVNTNGFGITWTGGFNSGRVFGAVS